jgi:hypothetical protein
MISAVLLNRNCNLNGLLLRSHFLVRSRRHDTASAKIALGVVIITHRGNRYAFGCRMGEFVVSNVNADMRNAIAARIEEYEIAGAKIIAIDFLALIPAEHVSRTTRQDDAELLEYIPRKSGAIESARCRTAVIVVNSDELINRLVELGVSERAAHLESEHYCKGKQKH